MNNVRFVQKEKIFQGQGPVNGFSREWSMGFSLKNKKFVLLLHEVKQQYPSHDYSNSLFLQLFSRKRRLQHLQFKFESDSLIAYQFTKDSTRDSRTLYMKHE